MFGFATFACQTALKYLQEELCVPVTTIASRRHLRSADRGDLQFWQQELSFSSLLQVLPNFRTVY